MDPRATTDQSPIISSASGKNRTASDFLGPAQAPVAPLMPPIMTPYADTSSEAFQHYDPTLLADVHQELAEAGNIRPTIEGLSRQGASLASDNSHVERDEAFKRQIIAFEESLGPDDAPPPSRTKRDNSSESDEFTSGFSWISLGSSNGKGEGSSRVGECQGRKAGSHK